MSRVVAFLRSLGVEGAARNARRMLDERNRERAVIDALAASMANVTRADRVRPTPVVTAAA